MRDIWAFLLQTLTASGAAALLLCVKWMLRDKLTPRWQFGVWGVLALALLIPAGRWGRYALVNWPWLVETAKTALTGEYTLTRVDAPIPLPPLKMPGTEAEWLFSIYCAGVLFCLLRYLVSHVLLRLALKHGAAASSDCLERVQAVAAQYGLPVCRSVELNDLPTAFVCGVFRPTLALPAEAMLDDKVIVHELLHLKYHDTAWGTTAQGVLYLFGRSWLTFPVIVLMIADLLVVGCIVMSLFALRRLFQEMETVT